ncbi:MAG: amidotransferase [Chitinophagaceae bacterium]|nr:amidotransferase [Chitinophagaceae bacterium]
MHIHCFQHVAFETPGSILDWAAQHGHTISYSLFAEQRQQFPSLDSIDALLIMGGPMNVDEESTYPWLKAEKRYIKSAIDSGKKIIGICLGAQLIAAALGEPVFRGKEKEIGFFPVSFSSIARQNPWFAHFPERYTVFHWHGDTFDLPEQARLIASTAVCRSQAFVIGDNILGIQFHPEMTKETIEQMLLHDAGELSEKGPWIQQAEAIRNGYDHLEQNRKDLFTLLDKFFEGMK